MKVVEGGNLEEEERKTENEIGKKEKGKGKHRRKEVIKVWKS